MELELREELDLVQAKVRETERARTTAYEIIADHEATIQKFRSLVNQVNCRKHYCHLQSLHFYLIYSNPCQAEILQRLSFYESVIVES